MIILDTNVVTEVMKPLPPLPPNLAPGSAPPAARGEFRAGDRPAFTGRILAFGEEAAAHYAEVMAVRKQLGRPLSVPDGQIAAIARQHGFAVATRNGRDSLACGIEVVNPFEPT